MLHFPASEYGILYGDYCRLAFPIIKGPMGPIPDFQYSGNSRATPRMSGLRMSEYAKNASYVFTKRQQESELFIKNDFWLVSDRLKDVVERDSASSWEFCRASCFDVDGMPTKIDYWVAKVINFLDCIDEEASDIESTVEIELSDDLKSRFCNLEPDYYRFYSKVNSIRLRSESIPKGTTVFSPLYWPEYVIVNRDLFLKIHDATKGDVWGLPLSDPWREMMKLRRLYM